MLDFTEKIKTIQDMNTLLALKEQIKDEIVDKNTSWQTRLILYKKVKLINEFINNHAMK
ncbi:hypothetical protein [Ammoniphilus resinae]|uniref:Uncharacterized protein n=1 Tax=Ammoniphilus resinae TaxID=861532 RepID=A0ABS4GQ59_9BACL|nr:hypothetical protein [Ammoniphilus resinae]MBP1932399.1 hypothetical protein [Ammoniphilus resinae]